jgi:spore maturation protein CgeB
MKILRIVLTGEEPPFYTITEAFKKAFDEVDTLYWDEYNPQDLNGIIQARIRAIKYDSVFMQIQYPDIISIETARILSQNALVFNWTGDVRNEIVWYEQIAPYVVTLFTNMNDVEKIRSIGCKADYLQVGYDHNYYFNTETTRFSNIVFCGNYYPNSGFPLTPERVEAVRTLENHPEFKLYGKQWEQLSIHTEGFADNKTEALVYNRSLLALNISHYNYSRYFSDRLLREMACGCCVISHRFRDCDFIENKEIVFYDDMEDLKKKAFYYFSNPEEAIEIGKAAAKRVESDFKWDNFTANFKNLINKYGNNINAVSGIAI